MLRLFVYIFLVLLTVRQVHAQHGTGRDLYVMASYTEPASNETGAAASAVNTPVEAVTITQLLQGTAAKKQLRFIMGVSRGKRPLEVYYFPGKSNKRALVIGGVHGTELASVEVAKSLIRQLRRGDTPYYNVFVIPTLFPDNAAMAAGQTATIGSAKNIGRYSTAETPDPNRQMPALGNAYNPETNKDALGRTIEYENALLLQFIQAYKPHRIVNIHAIRDTAQGGIYADPRTDAAGYAYGFASDSSLAVAMAQFVEANGGAAPGNNLDTTPTALYYKDPPAAAPGTLQRRNCEGSVLPNNQGHGVSLGSWASTAVFDPVDTSNNRPAIRLITMEFPGYKRPQDYDAAQQPFFKKLVAVYAAAIRTVFLEAYAVEEPLAF